jgi:hypothetical protein
VDVTRRAAEGEADHRNRLRRQERDLGIPVVVVPRRIVDIRADLRHVLAQRRGVGRRRAGHEDVHAERGDRPITQGLDVVRERRRRAVARGEEAERAGLGRGGDQIHRRRAAGHGRDHDRTRRELSEGRPPGHACGIAPAHCAGPIRRARVPAARSSGVAPGWFPDPSALHAQRYFDGERWTEHVATASGETASDPIWLAAPPPTASPAQPPPPAYGYAPQPAYFVQAPQTNSLAIASLVLGIVWICGLGSLLAVIFGHIALDQISKSAGTQSGRGLAIAGLILGYVGLAIVLLSMLAA